MIAWFTRNDVAANLLMVAILVWGIWSATTQLTLEVFPDPDIDTVAIGVVYRGATPAEVEESVVVPIEESIQDLEGIKEIRSTATEGAASVQVEVETGSNARELLDDIKARVDAIVTFPDEIETPTVALVQFTDTVVRVVLSGDLEERQLRELADEVQDDILGLTATSEVRLPRWLPLDKLPGSGLFLGLLEKTENVSLVNLTGVRPYEIGIELSEETLRRFNLTLDEVAQAVRAQSIDLAGGTLKSPSGEILLRTRSKAYTGADFENIVLRARSDGTLITVGDVATVIDGFDENRVEGRYNGRSAVILEVKRVGDQNAILISRAVSDYVVQKASELPPGVAIDAWRDRSEIVQGRLNTLIGSAQWAFLLVFGMLALFLRISLGGWVVLGIPVAFSGALILMPYLGATVNIASLFGFILVLGIVVDDAIVTGENIFSKLQKGIDPETAAIEGAREVARPVIFGVLTTMIAFIPLMLIPGFRGAIFRQIPAVIIPVLLFSLIESKLILPAHLKHVKGAARQPARWNVIERGQRAVAGALPNFAANLYRPFLELCLVNRPITVAAFFFIFLFTLGWQSSGRIRFMPFPRVASEYMTASLTMPTGTPYEVTESHMDRMERIAQDLRDKYTGPNGVSAIENVFVSIGGSGASSGGPRGGDVVAGQSHLGQISLELMDREKREDRSITLDSRQLSMEFRRLVGPIPGAEDFNIRAEIGRYGDPIEIRLLGNRAAELDAAAATVERRLKEFAGLFDIASNVDDGKEEIRLRVRPAAELLGIDAGELARQTRGAFFGYEAQRIQRDRDDIRVMVRYPIEERTSLVNLDELGIRSQEGDRIPFANLAELEFGRSPAAITRTDRKRTVTVRADADKERADLEGIKAALQDELPSLLAPYPGVSFSMEGEAREQREANQALLSGCVLVVFAIYCLLAIPFRSFLQPFIVMAVIPFGIIGAVWGHALIELIRQLTGHPEPFMPLSFMSLFGILALAGVVVNDSLVLVDWVNRRRAEGMSIGEAVRTAGVNRFRPIVLTSATTFVGLVPLVFFERSTQAQFLVPMAISLGFGILFATLITLVLVPTTYLILEDLKKATAALWRWFKVPFITPQPTESPAS